MPNSHVSQHDLSQAMSQALMDISLGRRVEKSVLDKQIAISDAINRRLQTKINMMKSMIEAKKNGIDFSAAIKEINLIVDETANYVGSTDFEDDPILVQQTNDA